MRQSSSPRQSTADSRHGRLSRPEAFQVAYKQQSRLRSSLQGCMKELCPPYLRWLLTSLRWPAPFLYLFVLRLYDTSSSAFFVRKEKHSGHDLSLASNTSQSELLFPSGRVGEIAFRFRALAAALIEYPWGESYHANPSRNTRDKQIVQKTLCSLTLWGPCLSMRATYYQSFPHPHVRTSGFTDFNASM